MAGHESCCQVVFHMVVGGANEKEGKSFVVVVVVVVVVVAAVEPKLRPKENGWLGLAVVVVVVFLEVVPEVSVVVLMPCEKVAGSVVLSALGTAVLVVVVRLEEEDSVVVVPKMEEEKQGTLVVEVVVGVEEGCTVSPEEMSSLLWTESVLRELGRVAVPLNRLDTVESLVGN